MNSQQRTQSPHYIPADKRRQAFRWAGFAGLPGTVFSLGWVCYYLPQCVPHHLWPGILGVVLSGLLFFAALAVAPWAAVLVPCLLWFAEPTSFRDYPARRPQPPQVELVQTTRARCHRCGHVQRVAVSRDVFDCECGARLRLKQKTS